MASVTPSAEASRPVLSVHLLFAGAAASLAALSLAGWCLDLPVLTNFSTQRPSLSPMTIAGLLIASAGAAALPSWQRLAAWLGAAQLVFGLALVDAETAVLLVGWSASVILGTTLWGLAVAVDRADAARVKAELALDRERAMVVAALSHDIRSPLHAAGMSTVLLQRLAPDAQAAKAIERLQRSHRRIDRMLRSLLDTLTLGGGGTLPFRRGDGERDASHPGWGVGLAFARAVALRHGGNVRVVSSSAEGTVFELSLPADGRAMLAATAGDG